MPKWIIEALDIYADGGDWEDWESLLQRINGLLSRAMHHVDNELLYEEILKEVTNVKTDS